MPKNNILGKTIGIIGGGQLGRMMATTARHMGYQLVILDPTPGCSAAQLADHHIIADYADFEAIKQLAALVDLVTYEFENIDLKTARYLAETGKLPQGTKAIEVTQDREQEKRLMEKLAQPVAPFKLITAPADFNRASEQIGFPAVVKTCRGGYDGKGQVIIRSEADLAEAEQMLAENQRLIYEAFIPFDCEISIIFTRSQAGDIRYFPIAENRHREHILHLTVAPAQISESIANQAKQAAELIAAELEVVGTFAIEFFAQGDKLYINELAPRPHNSGHYTIEACNVSQFEQHIRAICDLPLIPILFHGGAVMVNLLGDNLQTYIEKTKQLETAHLHFYGKDEIKPKRKIGHLTFVGNDREQLINDLTEQELI